MNAVQLKFADGKPTGIWYCGRCRYVYGGREGLPREQDRVRKNGWNREEAECCCTGQDAMIKCTGCRKYLRVCLCGRASKNLCVACGSKLFFQEGKEVRWGTGAAEICAGCQRNPDLAKKLMDAR